MSCVTFKGRQDGIAIVLDAEADMGDIATALREKIEAAESFFGEAQSVIRFSGRELNDEDRDLLVGIIKEGSRLEILDVVTENATTEPPQEAVKEAGGYETADNEKMTVFQRGSLRSGQSIRYAGNVVLMGDVNAGAEIVAEGNVVVMGAIKGLVHAGCAGDASCYVSTLSMQATQLRIADVLIYIPAEVARKNKNRVDPVYAHILDGQICTSPLMGSH